MLRGYSSWVSRSNPGTTGGGTSTPSSKGEWKPIGGGKYEMSIDSIEQLVGVMTGGRKK